MTKHLTFKQRRVHSPQINFNEWLLLTFRIVMNRIGNQLLTRSAFTKDQYWRISLRNPGNGFQDLNNLWIFTNNGTKIETRIQLRTGFQQSAPFAFKINAGFNNF